MNIANILDFRNKIGVRFKEKSTQLVLLGVIIVAAKFGYTVTVDDINLAMTNFLNVYDAIILLVTQIGVFFTKDTE
jgi:uncharacterized membrane protein